MRDDVPGIVHASRTSRGGHDVGLDRRFEAVDPHRALDLTHGVEQGALVDDRVHLVVVRHGALELVVEPVGRTLADADHGRADLCQGEHERPLVGREGRFEEDDVHDLSMTSP